MTPDTVRRISTEKLLELVIQCVEAPCLAAAVMDEAERRALTLGRPVKVRLAQLAQYDTTPDEPTS